jgi:hypothetical protein
MTEVVIECFHEASLRLRDFPTIGQASRCRIQVRHVPGQAGPVVPHFHSRPAVPTPSREHPAVPSVAEDR